MNDGLKSSMDSIFTIPVHSPNFPNPLVGHKFVLPQIKLTKPDTCVQIQSHSLELHIVPSKHGSIAFVKFLRRRKLRPELNFQSLSHKLFREIYCLLSVQLRIYCSKAPMKLLFDSKYLWEANKTCFLSVCVGMQHCI